MPQLRTPLFDKSADFYINHFGLCVACAIANREGVLRGLARSDIDAAAVSRPDRLFGFGSIFTSFALDTL